MYGCTGGMNCNNPVDRFTTSRLSTSTPSVDSAVLQHIYRSNGRYTICHNGWTTEDDTETEKVTKCVLPQDLKTSRTLERLVLFSARLKHSHLQAKHIGTKLYGFDQIFSPSNPLLYVCILEAVSSVTTDIHRAGDLNSLKPDLIIPRHHL